MWVVLFVIILVIIGQEGAYTYNFMWGFGPEGIYAAGRRYSRFSVGLFCKSLIFAVINPCIEAGVHE